MASISDPYAKTVRRRGDLGYVATGSLAGPLVFSMAGLLTDCLALQMQGEAPLAPLRLLLIVGAAPAAAMIALHFAGGADGRAS